MAVGVLKALYIYIERERVYIYMYIFKYRVISHTEVSCQSK